MQENGYETNLDCTAGPPGCNKISLSEQKNNKPKSFSSVNSITKYCINFNKNSANNLTRTEANENTQKRKLKYQDLDGGVAKN